MNTGSIMAKDSYINARVDKRLKTQAEKVLHKVGISTTDAIRMLLHQIVLRKGLPFDARLPNEETIAAMAELDAGKGQTFAGSGEQLIEHVLGARKSRKA